MKGDVQYTTPIRLGAKYRDTRYGIEGWAVEIRFTEHSGIVIALEHRDGPDMKREFFDPSEIELITEPIKVTGFSS